MRRSSRFGAARAAVLADADSPAYMAPAFEVAASFWLDEDKILAAFREGRGFGWHEHHPRLFCGAENFFRAGYLANLVPRWLPALEGVVERLQAGGRVADIGCVHGASTILMAQAFPASAFLGVDYHDASIATARERAIAAGVGGNTRFEVAGARDCQAEELDLICFMDCVHDLGDPVGALSHCAAALKPGGKVLLVEPRAGDRPEENFNPVGRMFYAASTLACTPNALSQEVGLALGAQAGEATLAQIAREAGFRTLRRAAATPVNLALELSL